MGRLDWMDTDTGDLCEALRAHGDLPTQGIVFAAGMWTSDQVDAVIDWLWDWRLWRTDFVSWCLGPCPQCLRPLIERQHPDAMMD